MQRHFVGLLVACSWMVTLAQEQALPVRVGTQGVSQPRLIDPVKPWARFATGVVSMEVTISPQGLVSDVRVVARLRPGEPLGELEQGIVDAVRQWRFEPTILNGAAVPVVATVTVNNRAAWPPATETLIDSPMRVSASLTVNFNRYHSVRPPLAAGPNPWNDLAMPADFAVRFVWLCPPGNEKGGLTIDTTADEAWVPQRVRIGAQSQDLERLYLAMRDGGTFERWSERPGGGWGEPMPSGITTIVRPEGVEVTVNHAPSPMDIKNTIPWMADFGWNLEFRLNGVWRRSARIGYRADGTEHVIPPQELPLLLDMLARSDDVKRLSIPLPRECR